MRAVTDDLQAAAKWLDDAAAMSNNAGVVLERVSAGLSDEVHAASTVLLDCLDRTRKALASLENV